MSRRWTLPGAPLAVVVALTMCSSVRAAVVDMKVGSFGGGRLSSPIGVTVDQATHEPYVASLLEDRIEKFDTSGRLLAPPSPLGVGTFTIGEAPLYSGLAVNPLDGDLYALDAGDQAIQTYNGSTGALISEFSIAGSANLLGSFTAVQIASDSAGDVYVPNAPNNEVQVFGPGGGAPSGAVASTITGSGASALSAPTGVAVDSDGDVFVADNGNGRLEEFNPGGAFVMAVGAGVDQTTGGNVCTAASGDTCGPSSDGTQALALDAQGDIYAAENNGSDFRVVVYDHSGIQLSEFGAGTIGASAFGSINTLAVDQQTGMVYVADGADNVVWVYGPPVVLPDVTTGLPAGLTATTASLATTVNPAGTSVSGCRVEYGLSTVYGAAAPCAQAPPITGSAPVAESASLSALQPNATYHYRGVAVNANGSGYGEDQTFATPAAPPSLDSTLATAVTQTSAILTASINPNNQDTSYRFEFGDSGAYGTDLPASDADLGGGYGDAVVGQKVSALTAGTTYHFRVIATNATGQQVGEGETFTTPAPTPPILSAGAAETVTSSAATLSGTVDPQGVRSTYEFDLGTDTGYGSRIFGDAGSGTGPQALSIRVEGLAPATTYHYRLRVVNAFGEAVGADETFTTLAIPSASLVAPPAPALLAAPRFETPQLPTKTGLRTRPHKSRTKKSNAHRRGKKVKRIKHASSKQGGHR